MNGHSRQVASSFIIRVNSADFLTKSKSVNYYKLYSLVLV